MMNFFALTILSPPPAIPGSHRPRPLSLLLPLMLLLLLMRLRSLIIGRATTEMTVPDDLPSPPSPPPPSDG